jgi:glucose-1-phosphate cytidylyltransferase
MLKVVVLCGGRGRRLEALSSNLPKPLVVLKDKPILQHILEFYISKGFRDFILCTGFRAEAIDEFISSHEFDATVEISNAGKQASMLKRIYEARYLIENKAIVTYGDTFINIDPFDAIDKHNASGAEATITVADIRSPFGLVKTTDSGRVISFQEKPVFSYYIGHMILERKTIDGLDTRLLLLPDGEGLIALFRQLIEKKKMNAYKHSGLQITFNTRYERRKAEEEFFKFFTEQEGEYE